MIVIIDYGLSNIFSVKQAFNMFAEDVIVSQEENVIEKASHLVLPGVGAFEYGMLGLQKLDLITIIQEKVNAGTPLLGICLGMQMLFEESDEEGIHKGLGLIPGRVEKIPFFDADGKKQCVPHIGWAGLLPNNDDKFSSPLLNNISVGAETYFVHSYEGKPTNPNCNVASIMYGGRRVCAVVSNGNVYGCQFHPEKSGSEGLKIIKNFVEK